MALEKEGVFSVTMDSSANEVTLSVNPTTGEVTAVGVLSRSVDGVPYLSLRGHVDDMPAELAAQAKIVFSAVLALLAAMNGYTENSK